MAHIKGKKSHAIIQQGLKILENLDHRGAVGADKLMGDGAGILIQIPDTLYRDEFSQQGIVLPPPGEYGVAMVFLPKETASRLACEQELERSVRAEGQVVLGWRNVPVDVDMPMSPAVRDCEPVIRQLFIGRGADVMVPDALERKLYVIRKTASHAIQNMRLAHGKEYFVPSASVRTVVYKGLLLADQVGRYYRDLADPRTVSALALVHQRFSTNTFPAWPLAHPYRMIAHNGEINGQGQLQLAARARRHDAVGRAGRRPEKALSHRLRRPVGHRYVRQLPGTAGELGLLAGPRHDDDDPGSLGTAHADGRKPPRVL